jgi:hypothetical protein
MVPMYENKEPTPRGYEHKIFSITGKWKAQENKNISTRR